MDKTFLEQVKLKLEAEQQSLTERLAGLATRGNGRTRPPTAQWEDLGEKEDENAAEVATYQDNLSIEQKLEGSLVDVRRALKALEDGTYGKCAKCGKPIEPARLEIFPTAQFCLEHKTEGK